MKKAEQLAEITKIALEKRDKLARKKADDLAFKLLKKCNELAESGKSHCEYTIGTKYKDYNLWCLIVKYTMDMLSGEGFSYDWTYSAYLEKIKIQIWWVESRPIRRNK